MKQSPLEKKLSEVTLNLTDKILYFPCRGGRPRTEYPDISWFQVSKKQPHQTLYVACSGRSYVQIVENINKALFPNGKSFFEMSNYDRKMMYKIMIEKDYLRYSDRRLWQKDMGMKLIFN